MADLQFYHLCTCNRVLDALLQCQYIVLLRHCINPCTCGCHFMLILSSGPKDLINEQEIVSLDLFGELVV